MYEVFEIIWYFRIFKRKSCTNVPFCKSM